MKSDQEKSFMQTFDILIAAGKRNRWEVWKDVVWVFAITISNAVDRRHFDEREQTYMEIINKYDKEEQQAFPQLFATLIDAMSTDIYTDFMGELYMKLEINSKGAGQFFTPYNVALLAASLSVNVELAKEKIAKNGYITVLEPSCGAGATLIAAADVLKRGGVNFQRDVVFVGQDLDKTVALTCYIQLSLLGCAGYVIIGDTLNEPSTAHQLFGEDSERCWCTPMFFSQEMNMRRVLKKMNLEKPAAEKKPTSDEQMTMF